MRRSVSRIPRFVRKSSNRPCHAVSGSIEPAARGAVAHDLGTGPQSKLLGGARFVCLDGLDAERELCGGLFVAEALCGEFEHLLLALAELDRSERGATG